MWNPRRTFCSIQHSRDPLVVGKTTILSIIFFICNLPPDSHLLSLDFLLCRHPVGWRWGRGKHSHHHQLFKECCISINLINKNVIKKYFRFFLRVCKIELRLENDSTGFLPVIHGTLGLKKARGVIFYLYSPPFVVFHQMAPFHQV